MIIQCESCSKKFIVKDTDIPKEGRNVQCGYCSFTINFLEQLSHWIIIKFSHLKYYYSIQSFR